MFTRRQAIRWAELWLSCWNDADYDTLLALYQDDEVFGGSLARASESASLAERKEALRRHWGAVPGGIHWGQSTLDHVAWDPEIRQLAIVYIAERSGQQVRACDLVTLDMEWHVMTGEPCVGSTLDAPPCIPANAPTGEWPIAVSGGR